jgi:histidyl-tRNA synthetase
MDKISPRLLKGFRDYGPEEQLVRQNMFEKIQSVFERFGFLPLSTPALEYKEILMGKYGEEEKLVYSFKDNGDRDVAIAL